MLLWDELHPYNCVHVVRVFAPLDLPRLGEAVNQTLAALKLGEVKLDPDRGTYRYEDGASSYEIKTVKLGDDPRADLAAEAARQLNLRFAHDQSFQPFRFFVAAATDSFFLGLVYFHALADGESVTNLLKSVVDAYQGRLHDLEFAHRGHEPGSEVAQASSPASSPGVPPGVRAGSETLPQLAAGTGCATRFMESGDAAGLELYPRSRDGILFREPVLFVKKVRAIAAELRTLRRARRLPCRDPQDLGSAVVFFSLAPDDLPALLQAAKAWEVTLNDLFLALLLKCFARQLPERPPASRRTKLAIGCIVNLRKDLGLTGRRVFGLFLGSFVVTCEPRAEIPLRELAREVRDQTARIKANRLSVGTPLELRFALMMLRFFSLERRRKFYQKNYPLWGGLTNMNLDSIWQPPAGGRPVEYLRAVSTGPATPLVLSITTIGGGVTVGLSYRPACFSATQVEQVKTCFLESVRDLQRPA